MGILEIIAVSIRIVGIIILVSFIMVFVLSDATLEKIPFAPGLKGVAQAIVNDVTSFVSSLYETFKVWIEEWFGRFLQDIFNNAQENTQAAAGNSVEKLFKLIPFGGE